MRWDGVGLEERRKEGRTRGDGRGDERRAAMHGRNIESVWVSSRCSVCAHNATASAIILYSSIPCQ